MDFMFGLLTGIFALVVTLALFVVHVLNVKLDLPAPKTNGHHYPNGSVVSPRHEEGATLSRDSTPGLDFSDISEARLRNMIQKIIAETVDMPPLSKTHAISEIALDRPSKMSENMGLTNGHRHRTEHYFEPTIYQDLLATAVLNKIVDKQSNNNTRNMSESSPDLSHDVGHDEGEDGRVDVLDQNYNIENQSVTSGSSVEPRSDCSYTDTEPIITTHDDKSSDFVLDAGRDSALSDYIAAHMVPLPDLSTMATESEEDDYLSVTSSAVGDSNWENNWLFKKKKSTLSGSVAGSGVGMLVPDPKEDVRAQIGDKTADEISDLSELGSDTDDSASLDLLRTKLDPINDRLFNKHLIGGQNSKMVLDELIERSSMISNTLPTDQEPSYTETRNENVDAPNRTEAINCSVTNQQNDNNNQEDQKNLEAIMPPAGFGDASSNLLTAGDEFDSESEGCTTGYGQVEVVEPTIRSPSVVEILAAIALGPMLAVPAADEPAALSADELQTLNELKDLALTEIKARTLEMTSHSLGVIPEEMGEFDLQNFPTPDEMQGELNLPAAVTDAPERNGSESQEVALDQSTAAPAMESSDNVAALTESDNEKYSNIAAVEIETVEITETSVVHEPERQSLSGPSEATETLIRHESENESLVGPSEDEKCAAVDELIDTLPTESSATTDRLLDSLHEESNKHNETAAVTETSVLSESKQETVASLSEAEPSVPDEPDQQSPAAPSETANQSNVASTLEPSVDRDSPTELALKQESSNVSLEEKATESKGDITVNEESSGGPSEASVSCDPTPEPTETSVHGEPEQQSSAAPATLLTVVSPMDPSVAPTIPTELHVVHEIETTVKAETSVMLEHKKESPVGPSDASFSCEPKTESLASHSEAAGERKQQSATAPSECVDLASKMEPLGHPAPPSKLENVADVIEAPTAVSCLSHEPNQESPKVSLEENVIETKEHIAINVSTDEIQINTPSNITDGAMSETCVSTPELPSDTKKIDGTTSGVNATENVSTPNNPESLESTTPKESSRAAEYVQNAMLVTESKTTLETSISTTIAPESTVDQVNVINVPATQDPVLSIQGTETIVYITGASDVGAMENCDTTEATTENDSKIDKLTDQPAVATSTQCLETSKPTDLTEEENIPLPVETINIKPTKDLDESDHTIVKPASDATTSAEHKHSQDNEDVTVVIEAPLELEEKNIEATQETAESVSESVIVDESSVPAEVPKETVIESETSELIEADTTSTTSNVSEQADTKVETVLKLSEGTTVDENKSLITTETSTTTEPTSKSTKTGTSQQCATASHHITDVSENVSEIGKSSAEETTENTLSTQNTLPEKEISSTENCERVDESATGANEKVIAIETNKTLPTEDEANTLSIPPSYISESPEQSKDAGALNKSSEATEHNEITIDPPVDKFAEMTDSEYSGSTCIQASVTGISGPSIESVPTETNNVCVHLTNQPIPEIPEPVSEAISTDNQTDWNITSEETVSASDNVPLSPLADNIPSEVTSEEIIKTIKATAIDNASLDSKSDQIPSEVALSEIVEQTAIGSDDVSVGSKCNNTKIEINCANIENQKSIDNVDITEKAEINVQALEESKVDIPPVIDAIKTTEQVTVTDCSIDSLSAANEEVQSIKISETITTNSESVQSSNENVNEVTSSASLQTSEEIPLKAAEESAIQSNDSESSVVETETSSKNSAATADAVASESIASSHVEVIEVTTTSPNQIEDSTNQPQYHVNTGSPDESSASATNNDAAASDSVPPSNVNIVSATLQTSQNIQLKSEEESTATTVISGATDINSSEITPELVTEGLPPPPPELFSNAEETLPPVLQQSSEDTQLKSTVEETIQQTPPVDLKPDVSTDLIPPPVEQFSEDIVSNTADGPTTTIQTHTNMEMSPESVTQVIEFSTTTDVQSPEKEAETAIETTPADELHVDATETVAAPSLQSPKDASLKPFDETSTQHEPVDGLVKTTAESLMQEADTTTTSETKIVDAMEELVIDPIPPPPVELYLPPPNSSEDTTLPEADVLSELIPPPSAELTANNLGLVPTPQDEVCVVNIEPIPPPPLESYDVSVFSEIIQPPPSEMSEGSENKFGIQPSAEEVVADCALLGDITQSIRVDVTVLDTVLSEAIVVQNPLIASEEEQTIEAMVPPPIEFSPESQIENPREKAESIPASEEIPSNIEQTTNIEELSKAISTDVPIVEGDQTVDAPPTESEEKSMEAIRQPNSTSSEASPEVTSNTTENSKPEHLTVAVSAQSGDVKLSSPEADVAPDAISESIVAKAEALTTENNGAAVATAESISAIPAVNCKPLENLENNAPEPMSTDISTIDTAADVVNASFVKPIVDATESTTCIVTVPDELPVNAAAAVVAEVVEKNNEIVQITEHAESVVSSLEPKAVENPIEAEVVGGQVNKDEDSHSVSETAGIANPIDAEAAVQQDVISEALKEVSEQVAEAAALVEKDAVAAIPNPFEESDVPSKSPANIESISRVATIEVVDGDFVTTPDVTESVTSSEGVSSLTIDPITVDNNITTSDTVPNTGSSSNNDMSVSTVAAEIPIEQVPAESGMESKASCSEQCEESVATKTEIEVEIPESVHLATESNANMETSCSRETAASNNLKEAIRTKQLEGEEHLATSSITEISTSKSADINLPGQGAPEAAVDVESVIKSSEDVISKTEIENTPPTATYKLPVPTSETSSLERTETADITCTTSTEQTVVSDTKDSTFAIAKETPDCKDSVGGIPSSDDKASSLNQIATTPASDLVLPDASDGEKSANSISETVSKNLSNKASNTLENMPTTTSNVADLEPKDMIIPPPSQFSFDESLDVADENKEVAETSTQSDEVLNAGDEAVSKSSTESNVAADVTEMSPTQSVVAEISSAEVEPIVNSIECVADVKVVMESHPSVETTADSMVPNTTEDMHSKIQLPGSELSCVPDVASAEIPKVFPSTTTEVTEVSVISSTLAAVESQPESGTDVNDTPASKETSETDSAEKPIELIDSAVEDTTVIEPTIQATEQEASKCLIEAETECDVVKSICDDIKSSDISYESTQIEILHASETKKQGLSGDLNTEETVVLIHQETSITSALEMSTDSSDNDKEQSALSIPKAEPISEDPATVIPIAEPISTYENLSSITSMPEENVESESSAKNAIVADTKLDVSNKESSTEETLKDSTVPLLKCSETCAAVKTEKISETAATNLEISQPPAEVINTAVNSEIIIEQNMLDSESTAKSEVISTIDFTPSTQVDVDLETASSHEALQSIPCKEPNTDNTIDTEQTTAAPIEKAVQNRESVEALTDSSISTSEISYASETFASKESVHSKSKPEIAKQTSSDATESSSKQSETISDSCTVQPISATTDIISKEIDSKISVKSSATEPIYASSEVLNIPIAKDTEMPSKDITTTPIPTTVNVEVTSIPKGVQNSSQFVSETITGEKNEESSLLNMSQGEQTVTPDTDCSLELENITKESATEVSKDHEIVASLEGLTSIATVVDTQLQTTESHELYQLQSSTIVGSSSETTIPADSNIDPKLFPASNETASVESEILITPQTVQENSFTEATAIAELLKLESSSVGELEKECPAEFIPPPKQFSLDDDQEVVTPKAITEFASDDQNANKATDVTVPKSCDLNADISTEYEIVECPSKFDTENVSSSPVPLSPESTASTVDIAVKVNAEKFEQFLNKISPQTSDVATVSVSDDSAAYITVSSFESNVEVASENRAADVVIKTATQNVAPPTESCADFFFEASRAVPGVLANTILENVVKHSESSVQISPAENVEKLAETSETSELADVKSDCSDTIMENIAQNDESNVSIPKTEILSPPVESSSDTAEISKDNAAYCDSVETPLENSNQPTASDLETSSAVNFESNESKTGNILEMSSASTICVEDSTEAHSESAAETCLPENVHQPTEPSLKMTTQPTENLADPIIKVLHSSIEPNAEISAEFSAAAAQTVEASAEITLEMVLQRVEPAEVLLAETADRSADPSAEIYPQPVNTLVPASTDIIDAPTETNTEILTKTHLISENAELSTEITTENIIKSHPEITAPVNIGKPNSSDPTEVNAKICSEVSTAAVGDNVIQPDLPIVEISSTPKVAQCGETSTIVLSMPIDDSREPEADNVILPTELIMKPPESDVSAATVVENDSPQTVLPLEVLPTCKTSEIPIEVPSETAEVLVEPATNEIDLTTQIIADISSEIKISEDSNEPTSKFVIEPTDASKETTPAENVNQNAESVADNIALPIEIQAETSINATHIPSESTAEISAAAAKDLFKSTNPITETSEPIMNTAEDIVDVVKASSEVIMQPAEIIISESVNQATGPSAKICLQSTTDVIDSPTDTEISLDILAASSAASIDITSDNIAITAEFVVAQNISQASTTSEQITSKIDAEASGASNETLLENLLPPAESSPETTAADNENNLTSELCTEIPSQTAEVVVEPATNEIHLITDIIGDIPSEVVIKTPEDLDKHMPENVLTPMDSFTPTKNLNQNAESVLDIPTLSVQNLGEPTAVDTEPPAGSIAESETSKVTADNCEKSILENNAEPVQPSSASDEAKPDQLIPTVITDPSVVENLEVSTSEHIAEPVQASVEMEGALENAIIPDESTSAEIVGQTPPPSVGNLAEPTVDHIDKTTEQTAEKSSETTVAAADDLAGPSVGNIDEISIVEKSHPESASKISSEISTEKSSAETMQEPAGSITENVMEPLQVSAEPKSKIPSTEAVPEISTETPNILDFSTDLPADTSPVENINQPAESSVETQLENTAQPTVSSPAENKEQPIELMAETQLAETEKQIPESSEEISSEPVVILAEPETDIANLPAELKVDNCSQTSSKVVDNLLKYQPDDNINLTESSSVATTLENVDQSSLSAEQIIVKPSKVSIKTTVNLSTEIHQADQSIKISIEPTSDFFCRTIESPEENDAVTPTDISADISAKPIIVPNANPQIPSEISTETSDHLHLTSENADQRAESLTETTTEYIEPTLENVIQPLESADNNSIQPAKVIVKPTPDNEEPHTKSTAEPHSETSSKILEESTAEPCNEENNVEFAESSTLDYAISLTENASSTAVLPAPEEVSSETSSTVIGVETTAAASTEENNVVPTKPSPEIPPNHETVDSPVNQCTKIVPEQVQVVAPDSSEKNISAEDPKISAEFPAEMSADTSVERTLENVVSSEYLTAPAATDLGFTKKPTTKLINVPAETNSENIASTTELHSAKNTAESPAEIVEEFTEVIIKSTAETLLPSMEFETQVIMESSILSVSVNAPLEHISEEIHAAEKSTEQVEFIIATAESPDISTLTTDVSNNTTNTIDVTVTQTTEPNAVETETMTDSPQIALEYTSNTKASEIRKTSAESEKVIDSSSTIDLKEVTIEATTQIVDHTKYNTAALEMCDSPAKSLIKSDSCTVLDQTTSTTELKEEEAIVQPIAELVEPASEPARDETTEHESKIHQVDLITETHDKTEAGNQSGTELHIREKETNIPATLKTDSDTIDQISATSPEDVVAVVPCLSIPAESFRASETLPEPSTKSDTLETVLSVQPAAPDVTSEIGNISVLPPLESASISDSTSFDPASNEPPTQTDVVSSAPSENICLAAETIVSPVIAEPEDLQPTIRSNLESTPQSALEKEQVEVSTSIYLESPPKSALEKEQVEVSTSITSNDEQIPKLDQSPHIPLAEVSSAKTQENSSQAAETISATLVSEIPHATETFCPTTKANIESNSRSALELHQESSTKPTITAAEMLTSTYTSANEIPRPDQPQHIPSIQEVLSATTLENSSQDAVTINTTLVSELSNATEEFCQTQEYTTQVSAITTSVEVVLASVNTNVPIPKAEAPQQKSSTAEYSTAIELENAQINPPTDPPQDHTMQVPELPTEISSQLEETISTPLVSELPHAPVELCPPQKNIPHVPQLTTSAEEVSKPVNTNVYIPEPEYHTTQASELSTSGENSSQSEQTTSARASEEFCLLQDHITQVPELLTSGENSSQSAESTAVAPVSELPHAPKELSPHQEHTTPIPELTTSAEEVLTSINTHVSIPETEQSTQKPIVAEVSTSFDLEKVPVYPPTEQISTSTEEVIASIKANMSTPEPEQSTLKPSIAEVSITIDLEKVPVEPHSDPPRDYITQASELSTSVENNSQRAEPTSASELPHAPEEICPPRENTTRLTSADDIIASVNISLSVPDSEPRHQNLSIAEVSTASDLEKVQVNPSADVPQLSTSGGNNSQSAETTSVIPVSELRHTLEELCRPPEHTTIDSEIKTSAEEVLTSINTNLPIQEPEQPEKKPSTAEVSTAPNMEKAQVKPLTESASHSVPTEIVKTSIEQDIKPPADTHTETTSAEMSTTAVDTTHHGTVSLAEELAAAMLTNTTDITKPSLPAQTAEMPATIAEDITADLVHSANSLSPDASAATINSVKLDHPLQEHKSDISPASSDSLPIDIPSSTLLLEPEKPFGPVQESHSSDTTQAETSRATPDLIAAEKTIQSSASQQTEQSKISTESSNNFISTSSSESEIIGQGPQSQVTDNPPNDFVSQITVSLEEDPFPTLTHQSTIVEVDIPDALEEVGAQSASVVTVAPAVQPLGNIRKLQRQYGVEYTTPSFEDVSQQSSTSSPPTSSGNNTTSLATLCQHYIYDKHLVAALENRRRQTLLMHRFLSTIDSFHAGDDDSIEETDNQTEVLQEPLKKRPLVPSESCYLTDSTSSSSSSPPPPPVEYEQSSHDHANSDCDDCSSDSHSFNVNEHYTVSYNFINTILFSDQISQNSTTYYDEFTTSVEEMIVYDNNDDEEVSYGDDEDDNNIVYKLNKKKPSQSVATNNTTSTNTTTTSRTRTKNNTTTNNIPKTFKDKLRHSKRISGNTSATSTTKRRTNPKTNKNNPNNEALLIHDSALERTNGSATFARNKVANGHVANSDICPEDVSSQNDEEEDDVLANFRRFVPGSIAEREYKKWYNAVDMPNNPYAPEALKRRISGSQERFIDLPNISPSTEQNPLDMMTKDQLDIDQNGKRESDCSRYSRDYYINNGSKSSQASSLDRDISKDAIETERKPEAQLEPSEPSSNSASLETQTDTVLDLYQAMPAQVVEDTTSSLDTMSQQSMQSANTTTSDDSDTIKIYNFKKQETTVIKEIKEKQPAADKAGNEEASVQPAPTPAATKERPTVLNFSRTETGVAAPITTPTRGSTPTAFKFLQPKRKLLDPSQVLSLDEEEPPTGAGSPEKPVIEKEVVKALPSVKALAKAFLMTSSSVQHLKPNRAKPIKAKTLPEGAKMPQTPNKSVEVPPTLEDKSEDDVTITSDLSSLETDPSSVSKQPTDNTKDATTTSSQSYITCSPAASPAEASSTATTPTSVRQGDLRSNIAFFENLKNIK